MSREGLRYVHETVTACAWCVVCLELDFILFAALWRLAEHL